MNKEEREAVGQAQLIVDNYYYMFECINAAIGELQNTTGIGEKPADLKQIITLLQSARQAALPIINPKRVMKPELRAKKIKALR